MEDLIEVRQAPTLVYEADRPGSIGLSREIAVKRVFRGGVFVLGGALLSAATATLYGVALSSGLPFALGTASR